MCFLVWWELKALSLKFFPSGLPQTIPRTRSNPSYTLKTHKFSSVGVSFCSCVLLLLHSSITFFDNMVWQICVSIILPFQKLTTEKKANFPEILNCNYIHSQNKTITAWLGTNETENALHESLWCNAKREWFSHKHNEKKKFHMFSIQEKKKNKRGRGTY